MSAASSARRPAAGLGLAALSAITGVISYRHGLDVARLVGNGGIVAYLVPLVPDLMIVTSSLTLLEASATRAPRPVMSMLALVAGIGWTTAMNIAAGWPHGWGGALVAAGVPLAFVLTFESLLWLFRAGRGEIKQDVGSFLNSPDGQGEPPSVSDALRLLLATGSQRELVGALGVSRYRVEKWAKMSAAPAGAAELAETAPLNGSAPDAP